MTRKIQKPAATPGLVSLADLLPPSGRYALAVSLGADRLREVLDSEARRRAYLRDVPPAFVSGPLAADGTSEALASLADARTAHNAAAVRLRQASAARAALPRDSTPGEVEDAEVAKRDANRAQAAAERAKADAERAAVRAIYDVSDDLADRRCEAYQEARAVAVAQATEAVASLTEALSVVAAADWTNPTTDAVRFAIDGVPAGSHDLAALIAHVKDLNGTAERPWSHS